MFHLIGDDFHAKILLQLKDTPRFTGLDKVGTGSQQEQISKDRDADRFFDPILLSGDLMLSQPQRTLEFPEKQFYGPPSLIDDNHLPGGQFDQIGQQRRTAR